MTKYVLHWCDNNCTSVSGLDNFPENYDLFRYWCFYHDKKILGYTISMVENNYVIVHAPIFSKGMLSEKHLRRLCKTLNDTYSGEILQVPTLSEDLWWTKIKNIMLQEITDVTLLFEGRYE